MMAAVLYTAASAFALGIFIRSFISIDLAGVAMVMLTALGLAVVWRRSGSAASAPVVLLASIALAAGAMGMLRMEVASWSAALPSLEARVGTEVSLSGIVVREPDVRDTTTHLYIDTNDTTILAITDRYGEYAYGDQVTVTGELRKPESFETDLGRTFDYAGYLRARDVSYQMLFPEVERTGAGFGNAGIAVLLSIKHAFMRSLENVVPEPHAGLGEGLLLGEKRALGEELETVFRRTGIIHIVVLSGYNVMLVVGFVLYALAFLFGLRVRVLVGLVAITAFALLVGLSATVVRASIMAALLLAAQVTGRTYAVMRALVVAGVTMLVVNPYLLAFDTGFQLSFLATMGLIFAAPWIEARIAAVPWYAGRTFLVATIAAQIAVLPLLLYQIGEFSVVSVIVNVLVLPMVPVAMLLTFATGMIAFISTSAALPAAYAAYISLAYILEVAAYFSALPFAAYVVPPFPFWLVPVAYACMAYVLWWLWRPAPRAEPDLRGWTIISEDELLGIRRE